ncbi:hypothetical protein J2Y74_002295 [Pseudomonas migulae]|uniref:hypothetical protein n=1 Tax=Pseudomonas migulae TaxID=78543 RepID=UPI0020A0123A|nr:hypothetical protein [Pseudomonas migulae]MCP1517985.1 hypothetical protein [Pseudomonas migulae]
MNNTTHCRSRLAGDEAREFCIEMEVAIASKLAPTRGVVAGLNKVNNTIHCRSRLAGDEAREFCIEMEVAIASKLAPTRGLWQA